MRIARRALGDSSDLPSYIVNIAGRGYKFVASVQLLEAGALLAVVLARPATAQKRLAMRIWLGEIFARLERVERNDVRVLRLRQMRERPTRHR